MGELQSLIHPGLCLLGQLLGELAGGQHYLVISIRQMVAVHAHIVELVIQANSLSLRIGLKQWPRVP